MGSSIAHSCCLLLIYAAATLPPPPPSLEPFQAILLLVVGLPPSGHTGLLGHH